MVKIGNLELSAFPLLLAPMEDVSDPPFRAVCKDNGADLMYTEFISSEGLVRQAGKSLQKLDIYPGERPMGIQIFGGEQDPMVRAVEIVSEAKPDLIDINFGCPVKQVVCKDAGSGLLRNIPKLVAITAAMVKQSKLPITVKTRLGWDEQSKHVVALAEMLQDVGVAAIAVHGRTRAQMYKGHADWTLIGEIKNNPRMKIPIFGNGDIDSPQKALEYRNKYGVDGIMIGRAAIGYPWIFREIKHYFETATLLSPPTTAERVANCLKHFNQSLLWKGEKLGILEMRRHYANYFRGYPHFKEFRTTLVTANDVRLLYDTLAHIAEQYASFVPETTLAAKEEPEYMGLDG